MVVNSIDKKIQASVTKFLSRQPDIQSLKFKDVREHVEKECNLESNFCKSGEHRLLLEKCIAGFIQSNDLLPTSPQPQPAPASSNTPKPMEKPKGTPIAAPIERTTPKPRAALRTPASPAVAAKGPATATAQSTPQTTPKPAASRASSKASKASVTKPTEQRVLRVRKSSAASAPPAPSVAPADPTKRILSTNEIMRKIVFTYLEKIEDIHTVKFRVLREHVEGSMGLAAEACKTGPNRQLLEQYVAQFIKYRESLEVARIMDNPTESTGEVMVHGRYGVKEKAIIYEALEEFMRVNEIDPLETLTFYRNDRTRMRTFDKLIKELVVRLPHRKTNGLNKFIVRHLMRKQMAGAFTEAEKTRFAELVQQLGPKFLQIGKIMGRVPDDLNQLYLRMQRAGEGGFFTVKEDADLIMGALTALALPNVIPDVPVPWTTLCNILDRQRTGLDYSRRYTRLLTYNHKYNYRPHIAAYRISNNLLDGDIYENTQHLCASMGLMFKDNRVFRSIPVYQLMLRKEQFLEYLRDSGVEDESMVRWSLVDATLGEHMSHDVWRSLKKECPQGNEEVYTFQEQIKFLLEKYQKKIARKKGDLEDEEERVREEMESEEDIGDETDYDSLEGSFNASLVDDGAATVASMPVLEEMFQDVAVPMDQDPVDKEEKKKHKKHKKEHKRKREEDQDAEEGEHKEKKHKKHKKEKKDKHKERHGAEQR